MVGQISFFPEKIIPFFNGISIVNDSNFYIFYFVFLK